MLSLDDERWTELKGGYRMPFDARRALRRLEADADLMPVWQELWEELHHQGDVGEASYAAVPHIVRICSERQLCDWDAFALVVIIDLARQNGKNPPVPEWLSADYHDAIQQLGKLALQLLRHASDHEAVVSSLAAVALAKGLTDHAWALLGFSADELRELLPRC